MERLKFICTALKLDFSCFPNYLSDKELRIQLLISNQNLARIPLYRFVPRILFGFTQNIQFAPIICFNQNLHILFSLLYLIIVF